MQGLLLLLQAFHANRGKVRVHISARYRLPMAYPFLDLPDPKRPNYSSARCSELLPFPARQGQMRQIMVQANPRKWVKSQQKIVSRNLQEYGIENLKNHRLACSKYDLMSSRTFLLLRGRHLLGNIWAAKTET